jgi:hypothetical protein
MFIVAERDMFDLAGSAKAAKITPNNVILGTDTVL